MDHADLTCMNTAISESHTAPLHRHAVGQKLDTDLQNSVKTDIWIGVGKWGTIVTTIDHRAKLCMPGARRIARKQNVVYVVRGAAAELLVDAAVKTATLARVVRVVVVIAAVTVVVVAQVVGHRMVVVLLVRRIINKRRVKGKIRR